MAMPFSTQCRASVAAAWRRDGCDTGGMELVVDTDTGIDDALALMLIASMPDVAMVTVTTTHGNCSTESSTANARLVLDTCGLRHVPVVGGLSVPLVGELSTAWYVHGHDGLGDCGVAPPPAPAALPGHTAVEALLALADSRAGDLDLLALGPLTNLGAALRIEPELLRAFRSVTIMGGTGPRLAPGAPDPTHGVGDPNTAHDAEAARIVAAAPGEVILAGVDVTMNVSAGIDHIRRIAETTTPHGRLADRICRFYIDFYESRSGQRRLTLHDPIAALVAIAPASIAATFVTGKATVEGQDGAERCVLTPIGPGDRVTRGLVGCDADLLAEAMVSALERPMPSR